MVIEAQRYSTPNTDFFTQRSYPWSKLPTGALKEDNGDTVPKGKDIPSWWIQLSDKEAAAYAHAYAEAEDEAFTELTPLTDNPKYVSGDVSETAKLVYEHLTDPYGWQRHSLPPLHAALYATRGISQSSAERSARAVAWIQAASLLLVASDAPVSMLQTAIQNTRLRDLAEALDAHRKRQLEQHPKLTMTGMYNVLEKLRSGESLDAGEQITHQQGLVSVLKELHDELDEAVAEAYRWPANLSDGEVLEQLVALNAERAAEEAQGHIRWLRPAYQHPEGTAQRVGIGLELPEAVKAKVGRQPWPRTLPEQVSAVRGVVSGLGQPASSKDVAQQFKGARVDKVSELLETLAMLGQVRVVDTGRYAA